MIQKLHKQDRKERWIRAACNRMLSKCQWFSGCMHPKNRGDLLVSRSVFFFCRIRNTCLNSRHRSCFFLFFKWCVFGDTLTLWLDSRGENVITVFPPRSLIAASSSSANGKKRIFYNGYWVNEVRGRRGCRRQASTPDSRPFTSVIPASFLSVAYFFFSSSFKRLLKPAS